MRKKIIDQKPHTENSADSKWLDLKRLAQVEISSEDTAYPIEGALDDDSKSMWKASEVGRQTIRLIFDEPQSIKSIDLLFEEKQKERTQEFVLRWSPDKELYREIVRQQYNFSPDSATEEHENYSVNLEEVKVLELSIIPDVVNEHEYASLSRFLVA
ncbi:discoidin domain-containing protein [Catalinimonas sp. 4WD22]|uniref:discoidin domain-containing protein n=1 Tax=Catalinimonas locisalis TaxID=3133978 RepID=UPI003100FADA